MRYTHTMKEYNPSTDIYFTVLPTGEILIDDDFLPFFTYLFSEIGIDIKDIKTPDNFRNVFAKAEHLFRQASIPAIKNLNNKYYTHAFIEMAAGVKENFIEACQKGNRYELLRKNMIVNK